MIDELKTGGLIRSKHNRPTLSLWQVVEKLNGVVCSGKAVCILLGKLRKCFAKTSGSTMNAHLIIFYNKLYHIDS